MELDPRILEAATQLVEIYERVIEVEQVQKMKTYLKSDSGKKAVKTTAGLLSAAFGLAITVRAVMDLVSPKKEG